tara:strand:- start:111 stop:401 length:291 start_codon:yes stop_codon:yes gene_type:complete
MKRSRGLRSASRKKLSKSIRDKGLSPITRSLIKYKEGEKVSIVIDPSIQKGQPHSRFHGLTGEVVGTQGQAYLVKTRIGRMYKELIVRSEHLRKAN